MDGTNDYKFITSDAGQTAYAKAVAEGLIEFLGLKKKTTSKPTVEKEIYRVRKEWNDPSSQIGAYESLDNAKKACNKGYSVFDSKGNVVYSNKLKSVKEVAQEVLAGKWGNGADRKKRLKAAGYDYDVIQAEVNKLSGKKTTTKKSNETIAKEVLAGKWGNGVVRKAKLIAAGYNPTAIQAIVNKLIK